MQTVLRNKWTSNSPTTQEYYSKELVLNDIYLLDDRHQINKYW